MSGDENAPGARIARARRRRGLSQSVLAGLVGRSESWLSQVERGKRGVDSYAVLIRMAEVLRVEIEELTGPGGGDGEEGQRVYEPTAEIERAMMGYQAVSASIGGREAAAKATATASLQLGDAKTAIDTGESLDLASLPAGLTGRRTQLNLDLARAYAMRKQDAAAVNLLLAAERLSPQLVRYDGRTREVITSLLRREHQPSTPELRPLARRAGVI